MNAYGWSSWGYGYDAAAYDYGFDYGFDACAGGCGSACDGLDPYELAVRYLELGDAYFLEGSFDLAARYFELAVRADPELAIARFAFADALFAIEDYTLAALMIQVGLALDPEWLEQSFDMRDFYPSEEEFVTRFDTLVTHVDRDRSDRSARVVLAYVLYFTGSYEAARSELFRVLEIDETDATAALMVEAVERRLAEESARR